MTGWFAEERGMFSDPHVETTAVTLVRFSNPQLTITVTRSSLHVSVTAILPSMYHATTASEPNV
jgi:hypothetical protein